MAKLCAHILTPAHHGIIMWGDFIFSELKHRKEGLLRSEQLLTSRKLSEQQNTGEYFGFQIFVWGRSIDLDCRNET